MKLIGFIKNNQQNIVLATGYFLVAVLGFGGGRLSVNHTKAPEIRVEEVFAAPLNDTEKINPSQSENTLNNNTNPNNSCIGQIKGNISSKGEKIYHVPGGAFYNRTTAEMCFATETEAKAAGFRKSSK